MVKEKNGRNEEIRHRNEGDQTNGSGNVFRTERVKIVSIFVANFQ